MLLNASPRQHLFYCLNMHPGETGDEVLSAIRTWTSDIARHVSSGQPFGLGLRLGHRAVRSMPWVELDDVLVEHTMYVTTINGFPYGSFHGARVKESVYRPDWTTTERLTYTKELTDALARLLPDGERGSISTVPVGWAPDMHKKGAVEAAVRNLGLMVGYLARKKAETGKTIHLGLEPEPSCYIETVSGAARFFRERLLQNGCDVVRRDLGCDRSAAEDAIRAHLGVCLDTCHAAVVGENLDDALDCLEGEGILLSKVQLSAALRARNSEVARRALKQFREPVYLHQVHAEGPGGEKHTWTDLPAALDELVSLDENTDIRVHFHVPLFWKGDDDLQSTRDVITPDFIRRASAAGAEHIEIETYTYEVLPEDLSSQQVVKNVTEEYAWVRKNVVPAASGSSPATMT